MDFEKLFEEFNKMGELCLSGKGQNVLFKDLSWNEHPTFEGVELKHLITSKETDGQFSYHLVRIAPNKKIGIHVHEKQTETHEIISGNGFCINDGTKINYKTGVISILEKNTPHEVVAYENGLLLFAKFIPALC